MRGTAGEKDAVEADEHLQNEINRTKRNSHRVRNSHRNNRNRSRRYKLPNSYADMVEKKRLSRSLMDDRLDRVEKKVNKAKRVVNREFFGEGEKNQLEWQRIEQFTEQYKE